MAPPPCRVRQPGYRPATPSRPARSRSCGLSRAGRRMRWLPIGWAYRSTPWSVIWRTCIRRSGRGVARMRPPMPSAEASCDPRGGFPSGRLHSLRDALQGPGAYAGSMTPTTTSRASGAGELMRASRSADRHRLLLHLLHPLLTPLRRLEGIREIVALVDDLSVSVGLDDRHRTDGDAIPVVDDALDHPRLVRGEHPAQLRGRVRT